MINFKFSHGENEDVNSLKKKAKNLEWQPIQKRDKTPWNLLIYFQETPIGVASFLEIDPETYQIYDLFVLSEFRHHKVASYMLKFIGTKAKDLGGRWLLVYSSLELKNFFVKNSFQEENDGEVEFIGNVPIIKMSHFLYPKSYYKRKKF